MSDLVRNPEDRFSHNKVHIWVNIKSAAMAAGSGCSKLLDDLITLGLSQGQLEDGVFLRDLPFLPYLMTD